MFKLKDNDGALEHWGKAAVLNPYDARNFRSLGKAYMDLCNFEKSLINHEKALYLDPESKRTQVIIRALKGADKLMQLETLELCVIRNSILKNKDKNWSGLFIAHKEIINKTMVKDIRALSLKMLREGNQEASDSFAEAADVFEELLTE